MSEVYKIHTCKRLCTITHKYCAFVYYYSYSQELKFVWIMSNENKNVINRLHVGTFLIGAFRMRNHLMQS